jgi:hypothetical protein
MAQEEQILEICREDGSIPPGFRGSGLGDELKFTVNSLEACTELGWLIGKLDFVLAEWRSTFATSWPVQVKENSDRSPGASEEG